jgi:membrane protease YdiL (CAAX protease family)
VWRIIGYAILFGAILSLRGPLESSLWPVVKELGIGAVGLLLIECVVAVTLIACTIGLTFVFRRYVDRRSWSGMALPAPWKRQGDLILGFGMGSAMILVVVGIEYSVGWLRFVGLKEGFGWETILAVLAARFVHFIATAVCEEIAYRSYLLQNVAERFPLWIAVLTTGAIFALSHFPAIGLGWTLLGFVVAGIIASYFLGLMRLVTRAIWLGVGWHLGWDWIQDSLGVVPGYSSLQTERTGPTLWVGSGASIESGVLIIVVLAAGLAFLGGWARRAGRKVDWSATLREDGTPQARRDGAAAS